MSDWAMRVRNLVTGMLLALVPVAALSASATPSLDQGRQIIQQRLDLYEKAFPNIVFTHAVGGEHWQQEYTRIESLLGQEPAALDYEHTPELENKLMSVTMARLAMMLQQNAASETLFRADKRSPLKGSRLCVITLNLEELLDNELAATRYMLDLQESTLARIHPARWLDTRDFLLFTIDHEAYHCLESAIIGGAPMTGETYGGGIQPVSTRERRRCICHGDAPAPDEPFTPVCTEYNDGPLLVVYQWHALFQHQRINGKDP